MERLIGLVTGLSPKKEEQDAADQTDSIDPDAEADKKKASEDAKKTTALPENDYSLLGKGNFLGRRTPRISAPTKASGNKPLVDFDAKCQIASEVASRHPKKGNTTSLELNTMLNEASDKVLEAARKAAEKADAEASVQRPVAGEKKIGAGDSTDADPAASGINPAAEKEEITPGDSIDSDAESSTKTASAKPTIGTVPEVVDVDNPVIQKQGSRKRKQPDVIDLVHDEVIDVDLQAPMLCSNVYEYNGANQEFERRLLDSRNFRGTVGKVLTSVQRTGYGEIDLFHLRKWYQDLRFAPMVSDETDMDGNKWHFRLVMINPRVDPENKKLTHAFIPFLAKFYGKAFVDTVATKRTIRMAIDRGVSLMVILVKCREEVILKPFAQENKRSMRIVAAASFQYTSAYKQLKKVDVHLSWLVVKRNGTFPLPPNGFHGWRRQGFGLFLLKCMIKYVYASQTPTKECDCYLQCYEPQSFNFYSKVGFVQINKLFNDGFELLPKHLQRLLWNSVTNPFRLPGKSLFHFYQHKLIEQTTSGEEEKEADDSTTSPYMLMILRSGCLRHVDVVEDKKESNPLWCQYPPPKMDESRPKRLEYDIVTFRKWYMALPLIKHLLPPPYLEVAPVSSLSFGGDIDIIRRLQHTQSRGTKWMNTGEIDLMINTLLWDGRYSDVAMVFSCAQMQTIENVYFSYWCFMKAKKLFKDADEGDVDMEEIHDQIVKLYRYPLHELARRYVMLRDNVLQKLVAPNAGLLSRRVLVFPTNEYEEHWNVTFVFNASYVDYFTGDQEPDDSALRTCFFRCCSQHPNGRREVTTSHGIAWFLNLCYSVFEHEAKHALCPNTTLRMMFPFGNTLDGLMVGTETFPALFLPIDSTYFPKQVDGFNCGPGVATAIGIVLRDIVYKHTQDSQSSFEYEEVFSAKALKLNRSAEQKEIYCDMPEVFFNSLPTHVDYLALMREQWFRLFDCIAKEQHVNAPTERFGDFHEVHELYTKYEETILAWPTLPVGETKNLMSLKPGQQSAPPKDGKKESASPKDEKKESATPKDEKENDPPPPTDSQKPDTIAERRSFIFERTTYSEITQSGDREYIDLEKVEQHGDIEALRSTLFTYDDNISTLPMVFFNKRVKRPVKQPPDDVELEAELVLKKIKARSARDGLALEKARRPVRKRKRELCTQSKAHCDAIETNYGTDLPSPTILDPDTFMEEMEEYIEQSFIAWKWDSNAKHEAELKKWRDKRDDKTDPLPSHIVILIDRMIKALKNERKKYRKLFANEFKFTQKTLVKSVKYDETNDKFVAQLRWIEQTPFFNAKLATSDNPVKASGYNSVERFETIEVQHEWVKEQFGEIMYQQIVNMRQDLTERWVQVPRDVAMFIGKQKVVKVRYYAESTMKIVDAAALKAEIDKAYQAHLDSKATISSSDNESDDQQLKLRRLPKSPAKTLSGRIQRGRKKLPFANPTSKTSSKKKKQEPLIKRMQDDGTKKAAVESIFETAVLDDPPKREISIPAKWTGKTKYGDIVHLEANFVRASFGNAFVNEMMKMNRGFVDIPVGDYKPSRLHDHPTLQSKFSIPIHYMQSEGRDLCVSKSLASVFYALRWFDQSAHIDAFGEEILNGLVMHALERVAKFARTLFPSWIIISRTKPRFDWRTDLLPNDVFIGVLLASDGSCSHAITLHGEHVFDSNEPVALRLCQESLDYCTSTETVKSTFVEFKRGYLFRYQGRKKNRIARMTFKSPDNKEQM